MFSFLARLEIVRCGLIVIGWHTVPVVTRGLIVEIMDFRRVSYSTQAEVGLTGRGGAGVPGS
jgi:hypothetical protein